MIKLLLLVFFCSFSWNNAFHFGKNSDSAKDSANLATCAPPPGKSKTNLFVENENESTSFELIDFYETFFHAQSYELYNSYKLHSSLPCDESKKQYWYQKNLDINAIANFCNYVADAINSSYLTNTLCPYILSLKNYFSACSY